MNIHDFTKTVNQLIAQEKNSLSISVSDSRIKEEISERRIRDYLNKGILSRPEKAGKSLVFTQAHVEQVLAIRALQSQGVSDYALGSAIDTQSEETKSFGKSYYGLPSNPELFSASFSALPEQNPSICANSIVAPNLEAKEYNFSSSIANSLTGAIDENHPKNLFNQIKGLSASNVASFPQSKSLTSSSVAKISKSFSSSTRSASSAFPPQQEILSQSSLGGMAKEIESVGHDKIESESFFANHKLKMGAQDLSIAKASLDKLNPPMPTPAQSVTKYNFGPVEIFINDTQLNQCTDNQKEQIAKAIENVIKKNK